MKMKTKIKKNKKKKKRKNFFKNYSLIKNKTNIIISNYLVLI